MSKVKYFRDESIPFFELKSCDNAVHSSKKHAHIELSIGIVLKGTSIVECERESFIVSRGMMICIPPDVVHQCCPHDTKNWSFHMMYLKKNWIESSFEADLQKLPTFAKFLNSKDFSRINALCSFMQLESLSGIEKESFLLSELNYFLDLDAYLNENTRGLHDDKQTMKLINNFLNDNYLEKITLDDLCRISGLSKYYLIRAFENSYRLSPHAYLTMLRINHAKKELRKNRQITDVAMEAGFYDQSHFVKVFRQYSGTTPIKYLKGG
ncbi:MAG: AraC family transcriptional regulator [Clostridia bacterium]|nr:AraC family transcriptional regulator [Clostridia bacterium]